ncbi:MAG TPA: response regulator [Bryobacteraceae bacterium]|nr:response regulator [Bryobacteraceae bacterium]
MIESEPEDVIFLRDVLTEIGEGRQGNNWVNMAILEAHSWSRASAILSEQPVEIILLDLDLSDTQGIETFRLAQRSAQAIPMILLVGEYEQSLGVQLIREGAQDFLVKKQVDCAPLAHAMRNALERHRLLTAARAASTRDTLTGLLNRGGFLAGADRDRRLAGKLALRFMVIVCEIPAAHDEQRQDLALVEAADHLRSVAGPADLLARIEPTRFAMSIFDTGAEPSETARVRIQAKLRPHRIRIGAALFTPNDPSTLDTLLEQATANLEPNAKVAQASACE